MAEKENLRQDNEEREILQRFERNELVPVLDIEKKIEFARRAARNTLNEMGIGSD